MVRPTSKEVIVATFRELMCRKPYEDITVSEILRESGVSRGTFYKYFKDKLAVLEFIFYEEVLTTNFFDFTRTIYEREKECAEFLAENRRFYQRAFDVPEFRRLWEKEAAGSTYQYLETQTEDTSWLQFYCRVLGAGFVSINEAYLRRELDMTPEELAAGFQGMAEMILKNGRL